MTNLLQQGKVELMKKFGDKFTDVIYWFTGSWWAVIIHTIWFALWLIFRLNIHVLTLIVSLEAIYLCIFILMAQNRSERERELREVKQRKVNEESLKYDIKLDEKADRQLTEIKRLQKELHGKLDGLKDGLKK